MIQEFENLLRTIISIVLGEIDTTNFKVNSDRTAKWQEKREIEKKKHNGILLEKRIIYYSDFYDLEKIIVNNWEIFKDIFQEKKRFEVFFKEIETYRNTVAHGRKLLPYQEQFICGILGDLKTKIIIFHNKRMNTDDYFIKIIKINDNLGNIYDCITGGALGMTTNSILKVNDEIEIYIEAYDPKGRTINYKLSSAQLGNVCNKTGKFKIIITIGMVARHCHFDCTVSTNESDYPNIDNKFMGYTVLP